MLIFDSDFNEQLAFCVHARETNRPPTSKNSNAFSSKRLHYLPSVWEVFLVAWGARGQASVTSLYCARLCALATLLDASGVVALLNALEALARHNVTCRRRRSRSPSPTLEASFASSPIHHLMPM